MGIQTRGQTETLGDWAKLAIAKYFQKTIKYESDVLEDRDPEALHQMRIGMRRLRTIVTGFAAALDLPKAASEKEIGKIARILGNLRDLDVLQEALKSRYQPAVPTQEQPQVKFALTRVAKQRRKALKQVQTTLKHQKEYQKLKQTLQRWLELPTYKEFAQMPVTDVLPDILLSLSSQLLLHPGWLVGVQLSDRSSDSPQKMTPAAVESLIATQGEMLHSLRKQAKRVRYQMSLFTDLYGPTYQDYVEDVKQVQTVLGDIQDSQVLEEFLNHVFGLGIRTKTPHLAGLLANNRYQAWQQWQSLQHRYLNVQTKQAFRQELLQPRVDVSGDIEVEVSGNGSQPREDTPVEV
ncbi:MAG: CHAD domain-containing protein [Hormoscilla sp. GUM202]|nr:CHAD domain-containing protein [Hormoscilla sp. GUM202]